MSIETSHPVDVPICENQKFTSSNTDHDR